jgi:hypothetical protein
MKMSDVKVGMRLRSFLGNNVIEVTEITPRGFKYRIPDDLSVVSPHWSMSIARDGHEHFGRDGVALYDPA